MPDKQQIVVSLLLIAGLTLCEQRAQAGPDRNTTASRKAEAGKLFGEANAFHKRGMYLDALRLYRKARSIYPSFKIDLNIGGTLDAMGRSTDAAAYFERFLVQSAQAPQPVRDAATQRLAELKAKLGSVRVTCLTEGAVVKVNGTSVGSTPLDLPVYVKPGSHKFRLEKDDYTPFAELLVLKAGEHRGIDVVLKPAKVAVEPKPKTPPQQVNPAPKPPASQPAGPDPNLVAVRRQMTINGYLGLGAGVACTLAAVVLYSVGGAQGSTANDNYLEATDPAEIEEHWADVKSAKVKLFVGHAMLGLAAVGYAVSIYQFVGRPEVESPVSRSSLPSVGVAAWDDGGMVSLSGRF